MKKLVIQLPCYNEAQTLGLVLSSLPKSIQGIDLIETLVIDDGSQDATVHIAKSHGVHHVVRSIRNQGLARAFMAGVEKSLQVGADIIVNLDADNQYCVEDIPKLIQPILAGKADIVVGERPISDREDFSLAKKLLQKIGSWVVRKASRTKVPDAPSGFRAFSYQAAMRLNVFSEYTYTLETIIQAGLNNMAVISVPIRTNPSTRSSRLVKNSLDYVKRSAIVIVLVFATYRPFRFFAYPGVVFLFAGMLLGIRFVYYFLRGYGQGHIQSIVLSALLIGIGAFFIIVGIVTELIAVNRKLLEKIDRRVQELVSGRKE